MQTVQAKLSLHIGIVLCALGGSAVARGQTVYVQDSFACDSATDFGAPVTTGLYGWFSLYGADDWDTGFTDGVAADTDDFSGAFGPPIDAYENFLLTGHPQWSDYEIQVRLESNDNDAVGLVSRYNGPGSYYACYLTDDTFMGCSGVEQVGGGPGRLRLIRVSVGGEPCDDVDGRGLPGYGVAESPIPFQQGRQFQMTLSVSGGSVRCEADRLDDGSAPTVLEYSDPSPLPPGTAGLLSYNNGNGGGSFFDDVLITGFDPDLDGDGVPDDVESALGTSPELADSDGDGISDRWEIGAFPADSDGDGLIDALDPDSDDDGLPDRLESSLVGPFAEPPDTDCDGLPDFADTDSDGDGVGDAEDACPLTASGSPHSIDSDNDLRPADCDPDDQAPDVCGDRDRDGRDDCEVPGLDTDDDGLPDALEVLLGTDALDGDSDDDGLLDGEETSFWRTDPLRMDTDADGLPDGLEVGLTAVDVTSATASSVFRADADPDTQTSPTHADSDAGGISDGEEDLNRDGALQPGESDPNDGRDDRFAGAKVSGGGCEQLSAATGWCCLSFLLRKRRKRAPKAT